MKTSVKAGWIITILAFTIIFSLIVSGSDDWYMKKVLVQDAIYEYVPSSQIRISSYWIGATALSTLIGIIAGLFIYSLMEETRQ